MASLWSGGIDRLSPTHPLGNNDEFQGVSPLFHRPELLSARPVISLGGVVMFQCSQLPATVKVIVDVAKQSERRDAKHDDGDPNRNGDEPAQEPKCDRRETVCEAEGKRGHRPRN